MKDVPKLFGSLVFNETIELLYEFWHAKNPVLK